MTSTVSNLSHETCGAECVATCTQKVAVVTGVGADGDPILRAETIDALVDVLRRRAERLAEGGDVAERLEPLLRQFVCNIVSHFADSGQLDGYVHANIATALATADNYGQARHGVEDYSTFIRRPNPTDRAADRYFIVGRSGKVDDDDCPLGSLEETEDWSFGLPAEQLHVFYAFYHARSMDAERGAPMIPADRFVELVPEEIRLDPALEGAFLDVCLSDGAWELYQLKVDPPPLLEPPPGADATIQS